MTTPIMKELLLQQRLCASDQHSRAAHVEAKVSLVWGVVMGGVYEDSDVGLRGGVREGEWLVVKGGNKHLTSGVFTISWEVHCPPWFMLRKRKMTEWVWFLLSGCNYGEFKKN